MISVHYGEFNELAIAYYSCKCLLFSNVSEVAVANAAHNTALFVHFKGQSSIIRSLGHILTCWEMALFNLSVTDGFNGA